LFSSGSGSISPYQNGDLLEVGQSYEMTANPDAGYAFSSWQPVNVLTSTIYVRDHNGTITAKVSQPIIPTPVFTTQPVLDFTMQPESGQTIIESSGWQANFVAVPEPPCTALIYGGLTLITLCRRQKRWLNLDSPENRKRSSHLFRIVCGLS